MPRPQRQRRSGQDSHKSEFTEHVVQIDRVSRVVAGGKRMRFRATVIIGNKNGKVGIGLGKADEVSAAVTKAVAHAKRDMLRVPVVNDTIAHQVKHSFKSTQLILLPASKGTGIIAGGPVRVIAELAGIKNMFGKIYGSTNRVNVTEAAFQALGMLRTEKK